MKDPANPDPDAEITLLRAERFFADGGLLDRFQKLGDELVQFGHLVKWVVSAVPGLDEGVIFARFRFSIQYGGFGRHGARQTVERLLDLDDYRGAPSGKYSLRPSSLRAQSAPDLMRARASVWAEWLKTQDFPVPRELGSTSSDLGHHEGRPYKKHDIPKRRLVSFMEAWKAKGDPVPAQDKLVPVIQEDFPEYNVTRATVRDVHKEVFGELPPGRRRRGA